MFLPSLIGRYIPPPRRRPAVNLSLPLLAYLALVVCVGIAIGAVTVRPAPFSPELALLAATAFLMRVYATPEGSGGNWSSSNYVSLGAAYIFGPFGAACCAFVEGLPAARGPRGWIRALFNSSQLFISVIAAYTIYSCFAPHGAGMAAAGAMLGGGADWLLSSVLVSTIVRLNRQGRMRVLALGWVPLDLALGWSAYGFVLLYPHRMLGLSVAILPVALFQVAMVVMHRNRMQEETERRKHEEEREALLDRTLRDALTGLPNRILFLDRLRHAASLRPHPGAPEWLSLVYLDLDGFKAINDTAGHAAGDVVLQTTADRLRQVCREHDTVARLGGDEFVILLVPLSTPDAAHAIADRLLRVISEPVYRERWRWQLSASVGAVIVPIGGVKGDDLLERADALMYKAKKAGKNRAVLELIDEVAPARAV